MCKVVEQWVVRDELCVLYLDVEIPHYKSYRFYLIGGKIYKPVSMSHAIGKCIAINGKGNFIGKEVEFV